MQEESDLFGNPVQPGRGCRGRPAYQPTEEDRNKIKLLLAMGWSNARVANALDISPATLKRYFRADLKVRDEMRDRLDARRLEVVSKMAFSGNVTAMKELGRMIDRIDQMGIHGQVRGSGGEKPKKKKLGKKEQRKIDAVTPNGMWDFLPGMKRPQN